MNNSVKVAGAAVVSAGLGFAIGFKVAEKRLNARFEERLEAETADMREFYQKVKQPYASPEEAVKDLIKPAPISEDPRVPNGRTQYHKVEADKETVEADPFVSNKLPIVQNVFNNDGPRIITQDEFMANETDPVHTQATLTYYEASDQVCGEADEPIDNSEIVVGVEFKEQFGKDSSDPNVVHIRNEGLQMDFEVVRSEGSYEEEVLGQVTDTSIPPHKRVRIDGR